MSSVFRERIPARRCERFEVTLACRNGAKIPGCRAIRWIVASPAPTFVYCNAV